MMKKLFFTFLLAFSSGAVKAEMPQHWVNLAQPETLYLDKEKCPGECFPIVKDGKLIAEPDVLEAKDVTETQCRDLLDKPIWSAKKDVEPCLGESDCREKLAVKICEDSESFIDEFFSEVYCAKQVGFEKECKDVTERRAVISLEKQTFKLERQAALAAEKAAKEQAKKERLLRIKNFDLENANSIPKLKEIIKDIQEDYKDKE